MNSNASFHKQKLIVINLINKQVVKFVVQYLLTVLIITCVFVSSFAQVNPKGGFKSSSGNKAGIRFGYHGVLNFAEIGVGYLIINRPCNEISGYPICTFPQKLQVDLSTEIGLNFDKLIIGPKLSISYGVFSTPRMNKMYVKTYNSRWRFSQILYRTIGHSFLAISIIDYTDFKTNNFAVRPEIGIMAPQNIYLGKNGKVNLNIRLVFGQNIYLNSQKTLNLAKQTISLLFFVK